MTNYIVKSIKSELCKDWLLHKHYAKRLCSISFSFGLFDNKILIGILTIGKPASNPLCVGVCGEKNRDFVYELNRLCVNDNLPKNSLSYFVSQCLKKLPTMILISFADTSMNHNGYIYQATNWIYTGLSAKRPDWKIKGKEHLHSFTIADEFRGKKNRIDLIKKKYGDKFYTIDRPRKHRYIYFIGNKSEKKQFKKDLKYEIKNYPKGKNKRYDSSYKPTIQTEIF